MVKTLMLKAKVESRKMNRQQPMTSLRRQAKRRTAMPEKMGRRQARRNKASKEEAAPLKVGARRALAVAPGMPSSGNKIFSRACAENPAMLKRARETEDPKALVGKQEKVREALRPKVSRARKEARQRAGASRPLQTAETTVKQRVAVSRDRSHRL